MTSGMAHAIEHMHSSEKSVMCPLVATLRLATMDILTRAAK